MTEPVITRAQIETLMLRAKAAALSAHQQSCDNRAARFRNYETALGELLRILDGKEPRVLTEANVNRKPFQYDGQIGSEVPKVLAHPVPTTEHDAAWEPHEREQDGDCPF